MSHIMKPALVGEFQDIAEAAVNEAGRLECEREDLIIGLKIIRDEILRRIAEEELNELGLNSEAR